MDPNNNSSSRSGYLGKTRPIEVTSHSNREIDSKNKAHDLRQTLKDLMVEFGRLQSEKSTIEIKLQSQADELIVQLRDLDLQRNAEIQKIELGHARAIEQMKTQHTLQVLELQSQISDGLSESESPADDFEELDHEISMLKEEISHFENAPPPTGDEEDDDNETEERLHMLEERLDEAEQMRDEALRQREEDSKASTQMIEQLILKNQDDEASYKAEIEQLVNDLSKIDNDNATRIDEIHLELIDLKKSNGNSLRNTFTRIQQIQANITKKQRAHNKTIQALHDEIDQLKASLESLTTRQKQQMKEATLAARSYAEEKRKFVSFHREIEMLNSELVRESVEHETLMKELNKMDSFILSQMSAVGSRSSSASYSRNSRF